MGLKSSSGKAGNRPISFSNDAPADSGHIVATNSDLILSSSAGQIFLSSALESNTSITINNDTGTAIDLSPSNFVSPQIKLAVASRIKTNSHGGLLFSLATTDGRVTVINGSENQLLDLYSNGRIHSLNGHLVLSSSVGGNVVVSGSVGTTPDTIANVSTGSYETGQMKYVSDGDAGSPCLAVWNGTDWKRLVFGPTIDSASSGIQPKGAWYIATPAVSVVGANTWHKVSGSTTAFGSLTDFSLTPDNRLSYTGATTREFAINGSFTVSSNNGNENMALSIFKNGLYVTGSQIDRKLGTGGDVGAVGLHAVVELATNDYVEVFAKQESASNLNVPSGSLVISTF